MSDHHPQVYTTGRHGCWLECSCGWQSQTYTTASGAHVAFGQHLIDERCRDDDELAQVYRGMRDDYDADEGVELLPKEGTS